MTKQQFTFSFLCTIICGITVCFCLAFLLPSETLAQQIIKAIMCLALGGFIGTVAGVIVIVFEETRKDNAK